MQEKLFITNRHGKKLSALLDKPEKTTKKLIILCHGFKGYKDYYPIFNEFAEEAIKHNFEVLRPDFFGSGESDGEFVEATTETQTEDLQDILKYIREQGYQDLCLIGFSHSVSNAVQVNDGQIKCLVLWSPVLKHDHIYKRYKDTVLKQGYIIRPRHLDGTPVKIGKPMWESFIRTDELETLKEMKVPTLGIMGSEDNKTIQKRIKKYFKLIPTEHELMILEDVDHGLTKKRPEIISLTLDWIKKYL
ncbi:MAG: alpha/beta fold hydrolase [archaeon]